MHYKTDGADAPLCIEAFYWFSTYPEFPSAELSEIEVREINSEWWKETLWTFAPTKYCAHPDISMATLFMCNLQQGCKESPKPFIPAIVLSQTSKHSTSATKLFPSSREDDRFFFVLFDRIAKCSAFSKQRDPARVGGYTNARNWVKSCSIADVLTQSDWKSGQHTCTQIPVTTLHTVAFITPRSHPCMLLIKLLAVLCSAMMPQSQVVSKY